MTTPDCCQDAEALRLKLADEQTKSSVSIGLVKKLKEEKRDLQADRDRLLTKMQELEVTVEKAIGVAETLKAQAERATNLAERYENDWRAAKSEFGTASARLRDQVRTAARERDEARKERDEAREKLENFDEGILEALEVEGTEDTAHTHAQSRMRELHKSRTEVEGLHALAADLEKRLKAAKTAAWEATEQGARAWEKEHADNLRLRGILEEVGEAVAVAALGYRDPATASITPRDRAALLQDMHNRIRAVLAEKAWRYLGNRSIAEGRGVLLECEPCRVRWTGCAAESCCPECGDEKDVSDVAALTQVEGPRLVVQLFAAAMEERLRANDHKGGWLDEPLGGLFIRLREETQELVRAVGESDPETILREAADVGNFAMMVADVCGGLPREGWERRQDADFLHHPDDEEISRRRPGIKCSGCDRMLDLPPSNVDAPLISATCERCAEKETKR